MRPCKNPPPLTYANLLGAMLLEQEYSPARLSLAFGVPQQDVAVLADRAAASGELARNVKRGRRVAYIRRAPAPPGMAARRLSPAQRGGILTGYHAELWRQYDLSMAARKLWRS